MQQDEVAFPPEVRGHVFKNLPIESFLIEANAAPMRDVSKNLIRDRIDRALRLARTGAPGNKPPAHEILHRPGKAGEPENGLCRGVRRDERPQGKRGADADSRPRQRGLEQKISGERARDAEDVNQQVTHFHRRAWV